MTTNTSPPSKRFHIHRWTPPPQGWLKFNTDAIKNEKNNNIAISFVCADTTGEIVIKIDKVIGDTLILVAEFLTMQEAVKHAINRIGRGLSLKAILPQLLTRLMDKILLHF